MGKIQLRDFKRFWLRNYIEQYKNSNNTEKRVIKTNLYSNTSLTDDEKDEVWELIVRFGEVDD